MHLSRVHGGGDKKDKSHLLGLLISSEMASLPQKSQLTGSAGVHSIEVTNPETAYKEE